MVKVDNLILYYENISSEKWSRFINKLNDISYSLSISDITHWIGQRIAQYHYNFKIGDGAGAITIGYKHNSAKEGNLSGYTLRVEVNPQTIAEHDRKVLKTLLKTTSTIPKIKELDYAFDIEKPIHSLFVLSKTGREENRIRGTKYFGSSGKSGFLKVYDKKKERLNAGVDIEEECLTRVEYTHKFDKPITLEDFKGFNPDIDKSYKVSYVDYGTNIRPEEMSYIMAVQQGIFQPKDFTRTNRKKIEDALSKMQSVEFNKIISNKSSEIMGFIANLTVGQPVASALDKISI